MTSHLELPIEHFQLQAQYAELAPQKLGIPISVACLEFTQFWRRVGNTGYTFNPSTPRWQEFAMAVDSGAEVATKAYEMYSLNEPTDEALGKVYFGCFRFDFNPVFIDQWGERHENVIKIHFRNNDQVAGPLSSSRIFTRLAELGKMFAFIESEYPNAQQVHGGTWLYNRPQYRRLFPEAFTDNMLVEEVPFPRTTGIWGQFLKSDKSVDTQLAEEFLSKAASAHSREQLLLAFKYKILFPRAPIHFFHSFYGLLRH